MQMGRFNGLWLIAPSVCIGLILMLPRVALAERSWFVDHIKLTHEVNAVTVWPMSSWAVIGRAHLVVCSATDVERIIPPTSDRMTSIAFAGCQQTQPVVCPAVVTPTNLPWTSTIDANGNNTLNNPRVNIRVMCSKEEEYEVSGALEGKFNNSTSTLEFPETPLEGSSLLTSGEEDVASGNDAFTLCNGEHLEISE
jgi:hypothetical protein